MKSSMAILSVFIMTFAFCYQVSALPVGSDIPTACCFKYTSQKIPKNRVVTFYETSSQCSQPGIIFHTIKDHLICADPSEPWVQEYIKKLNF